MEKTRVIGKDRKDEDASRASTVGGPLFPRSASGGIETTIYKSALGHDRSGGTDNIDADVSKAFIHEAIHGFPGEIAFKQMFDADPDKFNHEHQLEYNSKSSLLFDIPSPH